MMIFPHRYHWSDLIINKEFAYGAEEQFENQAMMAVRLANFISAFLQVNQFVTLSVSLILRKGNVA